MTATRQTADPKFQNTVQFSRLDDDGYVVFLVLSPFSPWTSRATPVADLRVATTTGSSSTLYSPIRILPPNPAQTSLTKMNRCQDLDCFYAQAGAIAD